MGNRDYYEEKIDQFKMLGGYKAYLTIGEARQFDEEMQSNELFKKHCELARKINLKNRVLDSETDFSRREKLEEEILKLVFESDDLYNKLYDLSKEWYQNLLNKEMTDGESD